MLIFSRWFRPAAGGRAEADRPILIGTAEVVRELTRLLRESDRPVRPLGCVLLGPGRPSRRLGVPVLGRADQVDAIVRDHGVRSALLSIPAAMHQLAANLTARLEEQGVTVRRILSFRDQLDGHAPAPGLPGAGGGNWGAPGGGSAAVAARLLQRPARPLDEGAIQRTLTGKRVLVTGAGGSIGSHIAEIVARFNPAELLLMERSENGLFEIDRRLAAQYPSVGRRALLHDVADARRTLELALLHRPEVVFHAAAHKHVPMMESHPREAVVNNFFGTKAIADAALAAGAERFVMISSDKAVNPTSVMGATKRTAELYVQHLAGRGETVFSMVRFGNVLGSACSVIPIWERQLAEGEPITVTDRRMTRYFMTIGEAASLVIQAASLERGDRGGNPGGGSIFVLDMGEPIRIVDLARRFLRMNGLEPGRDGEIVFTGTRPGEKLHEELAYATEDMLRTAHPSVRLMRNDAPDERHVEWMVRTFQNLRHSTDRDTILAALRQAVPQMQSRRRSPRERAA